MMPLALARLGGGSRVAAPIGLLLPRASVHKLYDHVKQSWACPRFLAEPGVVLRFLASKGQPGLYHAMVAFLEGGRTGGRRCSDHAWKRIISSSTLSEAFSPRTYS